MADGTPLRNVSNGNAMRPPRQSFLPGGVLTPRKVNMEGKENYVAKSDYQVLRVKLNRLNHELHDAKFELEETRDKLHKKEDECVKLFKDKRNLEIKGGLKSENGFKNRESRVASRNRVNDLTDKVAKLQSQLYQSDCDTKGTINTLSAVSAELQQEINEISSELESEIQVKESLESQCESLESAMQCMADAKEESTADIKRLQMEIFDMKAEKETAAERCSALVAEVEQCMHRENEANQKVQNAEVTLAKYEAEIKRLSEVWNQNNSNISDARRINMQLQDENASLNAALKKAEMNMNLQLEEANESVMRHKSNSQELIENETRLRQDLTSAHEVVSKLQGELGNAHKAMAASNEKLSHMDSLAQEMASLHKMNNDLTAEIEKYEGALAAAKDAHRVQAKEANTQIARMNQDFQEKLHAIQVEGTERLSQQEQMFKEALAGEATKGAIMEQQLSGLKEQLQHHLANQAQYHEQMNALNSQVNQREREFADKEKELIHENSVKEKEIMQLNACRERDIAQLSAAKKEELGQLATVKNKEMEQLNARYEAEMQKTMGQHAEAMATMKEQFKQQLEHEVARLTQQAQVKDKEMEQLNARYEAEMQKAMGQHAEVTATMKEQFRQQTCQLEHEVTRLTQQAQGMQEQAQQMSEEAQKQQEGVLEENDELKHDIMLREEEIEKLSAEKVSTKKAFEDHVASLHVEYERVVTEGNSLKERTMQLQSFISELEKVHTEAESAFTKKIHSQKEKESALEESNTKMNKLVNEKNSLITELEGQNSILMSKYEAHSKAHHQMEGVVKQAEHERDAMAAKMSHMNARLQEKDKVNNNMQEEGMKLEAAFAELMDASTDMSSKNEELKKTIESMKRENANIAKKLTVEHGKVDAFEAKMKEGMRLQEEFNRIVAQKQDCDEVIHRSEMEAKNMKQANRALKDQLEEVHDKASALEEMAQSLEKQNASLSAEVKRRRERKSSMREEQSNELLARLGDLESVLVTKEDEIQDLKQKLTQLGETAQEYKKQARSMKEQKTIMEESMMDADINTTEELNTLREKVALLEESEADASEAVLDRENKMKQLVREIELRDDELDTMEDAKEEAESSLKEVIERTEKLKEKLESKNNELKTVKNQLKCAVKEANEKIQNLNTENGRLEAVANGYREEVEGLARKSELQKHRKQRASIAAIKKNLKSMEEDDADVEELRE
eukprot:TRINITY_DN2699_c0_g2_i1.p1 TRINITY_DN2699_c0_g2~~TRINITY_DN2699_c0_g2_i1.p1  ORF type:complete len:1200 (+),score=512.91 TRINITY_DN2699_c0_g2_i1:47-3646(+)